jgi:hypothetical protein
MKYSRGCLNDSTAHGYLRHAVEQPLGLRSARASAMLQQHIAVRNINDLQPPQSLEIHPRPPARPVVGAGGLGPPPASTGTVRFAVAPGGTQRLGEPGT